MSQQHNSQGAPEEAPQLHPQTADAISKAIKAKQTYSRATGPNKTVHFVDVLASLTHLEKTATRHNPELLPKK